MSADVRSSFTTVNGPAPVAMAIASTSAGAGEELSNSEPPPAAAATPSAGPGSPPDVSQSEDAANGQGGPRKPNNMWTAEDREDMFNRRELGETWESICADYPNRSRHAMQQQYSMMKKQKALADGTWASNRRGRKRRNAAPERLTPARRSEPFTDADEHMTEGDDFEEGSSEDQDDLDDPSVKLSNGRPNSLQRSSTEPAKSTRRTNATPAPASVTPINGNRANSQQAEPDPSYNGGRQSKKRRLSGDQISNVPASPLSEIGEYQPTNVMLDYDKVYTMLAEGVAYARRSRRALSEERTARETSHAAALQRANRRANEATERCSWLTYEHGEAIKKLRAESAFALKEKTREHGEALDKLASERQEERRVSHKQNTAQVTLIEDLRREVISLKSNLPEKERTLIEQNERLRADIKVLEDAKCEWEAAAKSEPVAPVPQSSVASFETLHQTTDVTPLIPLEVSIYATSRESASSLKNMAKMVTKLHEDFEDLGHKRTMQYLLDIIALKNIATQRMSELESSVQSLHEHFAKITRDDEKLQTVAQVPSSVPEPRPAATSTAPLDTAVPLISVETPTPAITTTPLVHNNPIQLAPQQQQPSRSYDPDVALPPMREMAVPAGSLAQAPSVSLSERRNAETADVEMRDGPSLAIEQGLAPSNTAGQNVPGNGPDLAALASMGAKPSPASMPAAEEQQQVSHSQSLGDAMPH